MPWGRGVRTGALNASCHTILAHVRAFGETSGVRASPSSLPPFRLIGRGVYSLAEAERLTGVARRRIRRWTTGDRCWVRGRVHRVPPVLATAAPPIGGTPVIDFSDLIEVRFLDAFRRHGVSWHAIRIAAVRARELLGRHRPFSTRLFKTDGQTILAEVARGVGDDPVLVDLVRDQVEFHQVVSPMLYAGLEFDALEEPTRWWPLGTQRRVVVDPLRAFGAPSIAGAGIPTRVLAASARAEESHAAVAAMYEVDAAAVDDAVQFETQLAAGALFSRSLPVAGLRSRPACALGAAAVRDRAPVGKVRPTRCPRSGVARGARARRRVGRRVR